MNLPEWVRRTYVYFVVIILLLSVLWVIWVFRDGEMDSESARVYLQALTAVATLALLYYAYFNAASKREEDTARLELAVRPILIWELKNAAGRMKFAYRTIKHPIYDFHAKLRLGKKELVFDERHMDVSEAHPEHVHVRDLTDFILEGMDDAKMKVMHLDFAYNSEVGGKYELHFTKDILVEKKGFVFQHRNFVSAKYPWRAKPVIFEEW